MFDDIDSRLIHFTNLETRSYTLKTKFSILFSNEQYFTIRADIHFIVVTNSDFTILNILRDAYFEVVRELFSPFSSSTIILGSNYLRIPRHKFERFRACADGRRCGCFEFEWNQ